MPDLLPDTKPALPTAAWWVLVGLVALSPLSTKLAGTAWLLWVLMGGWVAWRYPTHPDGPDKHSVRAARWWLAACSAAIAVKALAQWHWGDPWSDRHFEIRLLLAAWATYAIVRRVSISNQQVSALLLGLSCAGLTAFALTLAQGRDTPTNPIPWAAAVAFIACTLLAFSIRPKQTRWLPWTMGLGLGLASAMLGVLLSESRGSYVLLAWTMAVLGAWCVRKFMQSAGHARRILQAALVLVTLLLATLLWMPQVWQTPAQRLTQGWTEAHDLLNTAHPKKEIVNTSVGARLYMWQQAMQAIPQAPWLGYGSAQRSAMIHQWAEVSDSSTIADLNHVHNEWLNAMLDHGALGALSLALYLMGLLAAAKQLRPLHNGSALALYGIAFMHLAAGLTNVNSAHNYYGVMLSLVVGLTIAAGGCRTLNGAASSAP